MTICTAFLFLAVGCVSITLGEPDDPVYPNRAPTAPVFVGNTGNWEKNCYTYRFYSEDPDGDTVYYEIIWNKVEDKNIATCSPDDPVTPWLGPFESGEEVEQSHTCYRTGDYELTVRAKDQYDNISPPTVITVSYDASKIVQMKFFEILKENYPTIFEMLLKIF